MDDSTHATSYYSNSLNRTLTVVLISEYLTDPWKQPIQKSIDIPHLPGSMEMYIF
jgi:hypothetical protein